MAAPHGPVHYGQITSINASGLDSVPSFNAIVEFFTPWDISPTVLIACAALFVFYIRGLVISRNSGEETGFWRATAFLLAIVSIYLFMQTRLDYWSQHMFWIHRFQHLVLHHIAPMLIALSAPVIVLRHGTPAWILEKIVRPVWNFPPVKMAYRILQNPVVASVLFAGLIAFWLIPSIHFKAMLSVERYKLMNWSMLIDGVLFWWLVVGPPKQSSLKPIPYGARLVMLFLVVVPQSVIGAKIALSHEVLFSVYNVCGRAWPIAPIVDQELGGLITWIPASMMSVIGVLIVLNRWMKKSESDYQATLTKPATENAS